MAGLSVDNLISAFIESLAVEKGYSQNTCRGYRHDLHGFMEYLAQSPLAGNRRSPGADPVKIGEIRVITIRGYLGWLHKKNKKTTIARKLSAVRSFFKYLVKRGIIDDNPADSILTPKQDKTIPQYLPVDDMFRLLDSIQSGGILDLRNRAIFETLYSCGIRVAELVGMNVGNVDVDGGVIRVLGKGDRERVVPIGDRALPPSRFTEVR